MPRKFNGKRYDLLASTIGYSKSEAKAKARKIKRNRPSACTRVIPLHGKYAVYVR